MNCIGIHEPKPGGTMRFTLPENVNTKNLNDTADAEPYFGLPNDLVDNDAIPLPPGLSRVRTLRKMHLELDEVHDRLKKWDLVQEKLETSLQDLRQTAEDMGANAHGRQPNQRLEKEYCYLQNQVNQLCLVAGRLDPRVNNDDNTSNDFITLPKNTLHYLAVYDDNPWEH
ncbi:MAG: hypothetical protein CMH56_06540 [Myxococcales bacterium]|nr:hypothetical protein [Myxococcales bacterium]